MMVDESEDELDWDACSGSGFRASEGRAGAVRENDRRTSRAIF